MIYFLFLDVEEDAVKDDSDDEEEVVRKPGSRISSKLLCECSV